MSLSQTQLIKAWGGNNQDDSDAQPLLLDTQAYERRQKPDMLSIKDIPTADSSKNSWPAVEEKNGPSRSKCKDKVSFLTLYSHFNL